MTTNNLSRLALVCLALASCFALTTLAESPRVDEVLRSLGAFVRGKTDSFPETLGDLQRAYKEFKRLPEEEQQALADRRPLNRLIIDFAIKPMKFVKVLIGDHELARKAYMSRMRSVMRAFYRAYKGVQFSNVDPIKRKPKMNLLCDYLYGTRSGENDADGPLSLSHFLQAKWERDAWLNHMQQIIDHEDIYSNLDEYAQILQYLNREDYKLIHKFVLPHVTRNARVEDLRRIFEETPDLDEPSYEYAFA